MTTGEEVTVRYISAKGPLKFKNPKDKKLYDEVSAKYEIYNKRLVNNLADGNDLEVGPSPELDAHKYKKITH